MVSAGPVVEGLGDDVTKTGGVVGDESGMPASAGVARALYARSATEPSLGGWRWTLDGPTHPMASHTVIHIDDSGVVCREAYWRGAGAVGRGTRCNGSGKVVFFGLAGDTCPSVNPGHVIGKNGAAMADDAQGQVLEPTLQASETNDFLELARGRGHVGKYRGRMQTAVVTLLRRRRGLPSATERGGRTTYRDSQLGQSQGEGHA
jgi:hypothetical protein